MWLKIIVRNPISTRNNQQKLRSAKGCTQFTWLCRTLHLHSNHKHSNFLWGKKKKNHRYIQVWKSENVSGGVRGLLRPWTKSVVSICQPLLRHSSFSTSPFKFMVVNQKSHQCVHPLLFYQEAEVASDFVLEKKMLNQNCGVVSVEEKGLTPHLFKWSYKH